MKKWSTALLLLLLLVPITLAFMQDVPPSPKLDITGVNATQLPSATITVEVVDVLGQPVGGLTKADFTLSGDLASVAQIVNVENVTDDNLSFAVVLVIDTSSSMAGQPIEKAKAAAAEFVNSIGDHDPVAIISFNNQVQLVQDYTTDKTVLLDTINRLQFGGETDLYGAALAGVQKAAESPTPRRAVILLSDGGQYLTTGRESAARTAAVEEARNRGVPVYTIGLGFGTDRSYLTDISSPTNARNYESPTPNQLTAIYGELARLFRSFYIVTLDAQIANDGTEYGFTLKAKTSEGETNQDSATLRAPIPVPLVSIDPQPAEALNASTDFTATVTADDSISGVEVLLDGQSSGILTTAPYTFTVDPFHLPPGPHTLSFAATDSTGDIGTGEVSFESAALPAVVSASPDLSTLGEINEATTVTLALDEQTPTTGVTFSVDDGEATETSTAPYSFTIDPFLYAPGEHTLHIEVTSESGATGTTDSTFAVAALPPQVTINGITPDSTALSEPITITVDATGQTSTTGVDFAVDGTSVATDDSAPYETTLDPVNFAPGTHQLDVTVTSESGTSTTTSASFTAAALPPVVTISGLEADELVTEPRTITVEISGQTPGDNVVFAVDGNRLATEQDEPFKFALNPFDFDAGTPHLLQVLATNQGGQSATVQVPFSVVPPPTATPTFTPTIDAPATDAAATQVAQTTLDAQATSDTLSTAGAATAFAVSTLSAQATLDGQATSDALSTVTAATAFAVATLDAQSTLDAQATGNAQATLDTAATQVAQTTLDAQATSDAATAVVLGTQNAILTATAAVTLDARATLNAQFTLDAQATRMQATLNIRSTTSAELATVDAELTANAQATVDTQLTAAAQRTLDAQQTLDAKATTDTENMNLTATVDSLAAGTLALQQTVDAQATLDTAATLDAQLTVTAQQRALLVQATRDAAATASSVPSLTPTERPTETATQTATEIPTEVPTEAATEVATEEATATLLATLTATTAPTEVVQIQPSATTFDATSTPVVPREITAPGAQPNDALPLIAIGLGLLLILILIGLFLLARRRRDE